MCGVLFQQNLVQVLRCWHDEPAMLPHGPCACVFCKPESRQVCQRMSVTFRRERPKGGQGLLEGIKGGSVCRLGRPAVEHELVQWYWHTSRARKAPPILYLARNVGIGHASVRDSAVRQDLGQHHPK